MDSDSAIAILEALGQRTRFDAVQLLLRHERNGLSSGEVARALKVPQNTMSVHLARLRQAGLIRKERRSRFIIYRAERKRLVKAFSELLSNVQGDRKGRGVARDE